MMPIPEVVWEKIPLLLRHRELVNIRYTTITSHTIMMLIHCQTTTAATAEYRKQCRMPKRRISSFVYLFIVSLYFFLFLTTFFLETSALYDFELQRQQRGEVDFIFEPLQQRRDTEINAEWPKRIFSSFVRSLYYFIEFLFLFFVFDNFF